MRSGRPPRSITALMLGLARLGLLGFGGVGPQAYHFFVERTAWLTDDAFAELSSVAQALPGANVVNLCAIVGDRWFGPLGAAAAVSAITVPSLVLVLVAAAAIAQVPRAPRLAGAECGIVIASAGLLLATAWRIVATIARRRIVAVVIAGGVALAIGLHGLGMPAATLAAIAAGSCIDLILRARP